MNQFETLLQEIQVLDSTVAKALPANGEDDAAIQAAAGEGGEGGSGDGGKAAEGEGKDDKGDKGAEGEGKGDDDKPMAKSLTIMGADGKPVEVQDATEMLKALNDRIDGMGTDVGGAMTALVGLVKKQGEALVQFGGMFKSLTEGVAKLGGQGAGRKAVVTLVQKGSVPDNVTAKGGAGAGARATGGGDGKISMDSEEFMLKALDAQKASVITGLDVSICEASLNNGKPPPEDIATKVLRYAAKQQA